LEIVKKDNTTYVLARELYQALGIKRKYANWSRENIERGGFEEGKDLVTFTSLGNRGGRPQVDHHLTKDTAISFVLMSGGKHAGRLRKELITLFNLHDTGLAFTAPQVEALIDLSRSMTLVSIQKHVERQHFDIFNNRYEWHHYRAGVLGYSTQDVINAMREVNRKHKSILASLMALDSNELIRVGVIDFMVAMGKTVEYATNCGDLCKKIAAKMQLGNIIWDDTKDNPIGLNRETIQERKELFEKQKTITAHANRK